MLVLNTANFWQHRYTFGYQNCTGGGTLLARPVHFWRPKVYRGGTNLVTKNVPPGTIFARYNFCVTYPHCFHSCVGLAPLCLIHVLCRTAVCRINSCAAVALRCIIMRRSCCYIHTIINHQFVIAFSLTAFCSQQHLSCIVQ